MSSHMMSSMKKILPVLLICCTVMLVGGAALYVPDVAAQAPAAAPAEPAPLKVDTGDTAFLLVPMSVGSSGTSIGQGCAGWGPIPIRSMALRFRTKSL